ncbi:MAG: pyridine nucleotide-disulfide oxidoreductase [Silanimonas sp.]|nr:MAG: pyridine nucleotide-disulfide oxidoreductase [Silanimonas sp.]
MSLPFDLAIVGGGPAGVALLVAARTHAPGWRIAWCRGSDAAFLPAYGGNSEVHRLNVPVERMGLDAEAPVDFLDWLRCLHPARGVQPGQFVPRRWFGEYLAACAEGQADVEHRQPAVALHREGGLWRLAMADGEALPARRVALCLGLPGTVPPPSAPAHWIADAWAWWRSLPERGLPLGTDERVLLVGSGLTAVDMVLGLRQRGFRGRIEAVSIEGAWPEAHADTSPLDPETREWLETRLDEVADARGLVRLLRVACARQPWRAVIDALRAGSNRLWAGLPLPERRRLLRHAFGQWNRHRHRMASDVLAALRNDRSLSVERGRVHVDAAGQVWKRQRGVDTPVTAALIIDCRGPGFRQALAGDALLARLVREGMLEANALGTGVRTPADPGLAVLGAALFGECIETTAVPELRQQALAAVRGWREGERLPSR